MFIPSTVVLYVENAEKSGQFYQELLGKAPAESSPTFNGFTLANGMHLGLKSTHSVAPSPENTRGELACVLPNRQEVDALFSKWQALGVDILQAPMDLPFGYTFLASDPDGHRLRVVSLVKS